MSFSKRMQAEVAAIGGRAYVRGDVLYWLAKYGLYKAYDINSGVRMDEVNPTIAAMHKVWSDKPEVLVHRFADVVLPVGGWALYGAHRMVREILGSYTDDCSLQISEAALRFARARKVSLVPWELDRLNEIDMGRRRPDEADQAEGNNGKSNE